MSDLSSLVLELQIDNKATLPGFLGRAVYHYLISTIKERDPAFNKALHDNLRRKPFTCSTLIGGDRLSGNSQQFAPDSQAWLRVTALTQSMAEHLTNLAAQQGQTAEINRTVFKVTNATLDNEKHNWAGISSYEAIAAKHISRRTPARTIRLEFASPTTFRMTGNNRKTRSWPVPMPDWVFGSLYRRWNLFSPIPLDTRLPEFVQEHVVLSRYNLKTRAIPTKKNVIQMGCVGKASFHVLMKDAWLINQLRILAEYAFYSGVGYQTTTGFGQTRQIN